MINYLKCNAEVGTFRTAVTLGITFSNKDQVINRYG